MNDAVSVKIAALNDRMASEHVGINGMRIGKGNPSIQRKPAI
jgi:hypothetical protein